MITYRLSYLTILVLTWPIRWLSYSAIHRLGYYLGHLTYYLLPSFRKRTLSHLSLASDLAIPSASIPTIAKAAFVNLMITCLEYPKLSQEKDIHRVATCDNPEVAARLMAQNKPVIFFCGHQANWEVLFLEGTKRMPGVAIGRPIANPYLYHWILAMREKYGGKIITPQEAIKEGLRALKKGSFLGIVGDQGRPDSGYCCPFFGKNAWTSPIPAILSYRTGFPIIVASTRRINGKYRIHYSDPLWPDTHKPMNLEIDRLMRSALSLLETSIRLAPDQWLWVHNRWKQQTLHKIKRLFRQESICIVFPKDLNACQQLSLHLPTFRTLYPLEFITLYKPEEFNLNTTLEKGNETPHLDPFNMEILPLKDVKQIDYRFKLVFNFSGDPTVGTHFKRLSALTVIDLQSLGITSPQEDVSTQLKKLVLCPTNAFSLTVH